MARRLIREEGLLCGGSCGTAMAAAVEVAERVGPGKTFVVILPDSVRNYMTKFMDDGWMKQHGFTEPSWEEDSCGSLIGRLPAREVITASGDQTLSDAIECMKEAGISQLPVVEAGRLVGIVTESDLLRRIVDGRAQLSATVAEMMFRNVETVHEKDPGPATSSRCSRGRPWAWS